MKHSTWIANKHVSECNDSCRYARGKNRAGDSAGSWLSCSRHFVLGYLCCVDTVDSLLVHFFLLSVYLGLRRYLVCKPWFDFLLSTFSPSTAKQFLNNFPRLVWCTVFASCAVLTVWVVLLRLFISYCSVCIPARAVVRLAAIHFSPLLRHPRRYGCNFASTHVQRLWGVG